MYLIVTASFLFKRGIKVSYIFDTRPICQRVSTMYPPMPTANGIERCAEGRPKERTIEMKNVATPQSRTPPCRCISFMITGVYRRRSSLEQTGNSFEHSGDRNRCRVSSLSSTIFGSIHTKRRLEYGTLSTGPLIRSLMMETSFREFLSTAGNTIHPSSTVFTFNRCRRRMFSLGSQKDEKMCFYRNFETRLRALLSKW